MKYVKILGLAAMALVALVAIPGTASATTLTSPAGTTFTGTIKAESSNVVLTSAFGGFGSLSCTSSTLEGNVKGHGSSVTVVGAWSKVTFTNCTGGEYTDPVATVGTWELHSSGGNTGTLTWSSLSLIIHNTALGTCTFSTSTGTAVGTFTGSSSSTGKAVWLLKGTIPATSGFCGQATIEGSYTFTSPVPLFVD